MNQIISAVFDYTGHYRPTHPDLTPAVLRLHPATACQIITDPTLRAGRMADPTIIGLRIVHDAGIPPGVWRICADDGRLIHDSRSGRTLE